MTTKAIGTQGIQFPDGSVQGSAAYSKAECDARFAEILSQETKAATGTTVNFTVPAGTKRMRLLWDAVSTNGTNNPSVRIGTGTPENANYNSLTWNAVMATGVSTPTNHINGFNVGSSNAAALISGVMNLMLIGESRWFSQNELYNGQSGASLMGHGTKIVAAPIDTLQITTVNQTDSFDGGEFTLICEA